MFWAKLVVVAAAVADSSALHKHGVDLYKSRQYPEAIAALKEASASEDPKSPAYSESVLLIGQSYFMLLQAPQAIPWLEKLPGSNESNYMLGYAYLQAQQAGSSEAAFARLFHVDANSAAGHLLAAQMMLKREFEDYALAEISKALALDARLPQAHFLKAEIELHRGQVDEGIADLRAEIDLDPNFSMTWYRLGDAYMRKSAWPEAIANLQRAVWLNPDFSGPFILLGRAYLKTGDLTNAEGILRRALLLDPRNTAALYALAQTLGAENKTEESKQILEQLKAAKEAK